MLNGEFKFEERKPSSSRRWLRVSIAGVLLVVVVVAVALTSNSANAVGAKNMVVGVETDNAVNTYGTTDEGNYQTPDVWDDEEGEDADMEDDDDETEDDDEETTDDTAAHVNVVDDEVQQLAALDPETDIETEENLIPKKMPKEVLACKKLCAMYVAKPLKRLKCQRDCVKAKGDFKSPKLCYRDCKNACKEIAPKGQKKMCRRMCFVKLCPRPLRFCFSMCRGVGLKHFKNPKPKYIGLCRKMCIKDKKVRSNPRKCRKKCKKACKKFVKKGKGRRKLCKKDCKELCPPL